MGSLGCQNYDERGEHRCSDLPAIVAVAYCSANKTRRFDRLATIGVRVVAIVVGLDSDCLQEEAGLLRRSMSLWRPHYLDHPLHPQMEGGCIRHGS